LVHGSEKDFSSLPQRGLYQQLLNAIVGESGEEVDGLRKLSTSLIEHWAEGSGLKTEDKIRMREYAAGDCDETLRILLDAFGDGFIFSSGDCSKDLERLISSLDMRSREIVRYLMGKRYAGIRELSKFIDVDSDMEILSKIREVINPAASQILNYPLLVFHHSKIDPLTGGKVLFKWWISENVDTSIDKVLVDLFKDEEGVRCMVYPQFQVDELEVDVRGNFLILNGRDYHKIIHLPYPEIADIEMTYNNGVLEINLKPGGEEIDN